MAPIPHLLLDRAGECLSHQDLGWKYAGEGVKAGLETDIGHILGTRGGDKALQRDSAAIFRNLKNDENGLEKFLLDNQMVDDPKEHDYYRFCDIKGKALKTRLPKAAKHRDTSDLTGVYWALGQHQGK